MEKSSDPDTAAFVTALLEELKNTPATAPEAFTPLSERVAKEVRELVQKGVYESAAALNTAQTNTLNPGTKTTGPSQPNQKSVGAPGPNGLVLYFPFDVPAENGVVRDASGAGNDAQVFGAQWTAGGKFGGAYAFELARLSDRVVVPNSDLLNPDRITISVWVKASDTDGFWNRVLDKDWRNGYCVSLAGDYKGSGSRGKVSFETACGSLIADQPIADNQWHHLAMTYDGVTVRVSIDGKVKTRQAKTPGTLKKTGWDLCIGNSVVDYGTNEFVAFEGLIDEVRIYNRALSESEITELFQATKAGADIPTGLSASPKPPPADAESRLKKLKSLYDQGLITKEDYDRKAKEIVDSL
ncbi:MAG: SHOCT domain-containing protein [Opitutae bacterium]|nr:SHOCT domain-containing protein [Opitutae bacterium]